MYHALKIGPKPIWQLSIFKYTDKLKTQDAESIHTFNPLALLMALRGLSTLNTLRIFTTEMVLDLQYNNAIQLVAFTVF